MSIASYYRKRIVFQIAFPHRYFDVECMCCWIERLAECIGAFGRGHKWCRCRRSYVQRIRIFRYETLSFWSDYRMNSEMVPWDAELERSKPDELVEVGQQFSSCARRINNDNEAFLRVAQFRMVSTTKCMYESGLGVLLCSYAKMRLNHNRMKSLLSKKNTINKHCWIGIVYRGHGVVPCRILRLWWIHELWKLLIVMGRNYELVSLGLVGRQFIAWTL